MAASGDPLPWPPPWSKPRQAGPIAAAVVCALIAIVGVVVGVSLFLPGAIDPRAFVFVALIPLMCGLSLGTVGLRLRVRGRSTRAVRSRDGALSIPFLRSLWVALWLVTAGGLLLIALLIAISVLAAFASSPPGVPELVVAVVLALLALPLLGLIVDGLAGRAARGSFYCPCRGSDIGLWVTKPGWTGRRSKECRSAPVPGSGS